MNKKSPMSDVHEAIKNNDLEYLKLKRKEATDPRLRTYLSRNINRIEKEPK